METLALVGPSGSGKSHRAILVAQEYEIDLIIDDGLLIKGSRILAGFSAKSQPTKVGAIKTALFSEEIHVLEVKNTIKREKPRKILILGTSKGMVSKIAERLELPQPKKILLITDIATPEEIKKATLIREKYKKHVIPAPTVEVKPKLSGILSAPIQTIFKPKNKKNEFYSHLKIEQTVVKPTFSFIGKFYIANSVLHEIIKYTIKKEFQEVNKIIRTNFSSKDDGVEIYMELSVFWGSNLQNLGYSIQKNIKDNIEYMTALHIKRVDILFKKLTI